MIIQGRNLQQGLIGDDVRLLHTELALLNLAVPDNERSGAQFGPATLAVIQQFQIWVEAVCRHRDIQFGAFRHGHPIDIGKSIVAIVAGGNVQRALEVPAG
jgi:hypothetical protein